MRFYYTYVSSIVLFCSFCVCIFFFRFDLLLEVAAALRWAEYYIPISNLHGVVVSATRLSLELALYSLLFVTLIR